MCINRIGNVAGGENQHGSIWSPGGIRANLTARALLSLRNGWVWDRGTYNLTLLVQRVG